VSILLNFHFPSSIPFDVVQHLIILPHLSSDDVVALEESGLLTASPVRAEELWRRLLSRDFGVSQKSGSKILYLKLKLERFSKIPKLSTLAYDLANVGFDRPRGSGELVTCSFFRVFVV
jgi:hypothetical protein